MILFEISSDVWLLISYEPTDVPVVMQFRDKLLAPGRLMYKQDLLQILFSVLKWRPLKTLTARLKADTDAPTGNTARAPNIIVSTNYKSSCKK